MKKTALVAIAALFLLATPSFAEETDYLGFVNIELNLAQMILVGDILDMGSGAVVDFNTGPVLWHAGFRIQYLAGFGIAGEAGAGIVFHASFDTAAPYTQVIPINSWTVGNIRYTEYERIEGKCPAAWLHVVEAGVRPQYLTASGYSWESTSTEIILYGGYRLVSYYAEFAPIEEIELTLHGLVGFPNRTYVDSGSPTYDFGRTAFGVKLGAKWQYFHFDVAYYDNFFYLDLAFRIPITIM